MGQDEHIFWHVLDYLATSCDIIQTRSGYNI